VTQVIKRLEHRKLRWREVTNAIAFRQPP
jgi:hypothetical protein